MISKKLIFSTILFALVFLPTVSAFVGCCYDPSSVEACVSNVEQTECSGDFRAGVNCRFVPECDRGCCIYENEGSCSGNTIQATCESTGGTWTEGSSCNELACQDGCCNLGEFSIFTTQRQCEINFENYFAGSGETPWDPEVSRLTCVQQSNNQDALGACVSESFEGNTCSIKTAEKCELETGDLSNFHWNKLCTAEELDTICEKTDQTTCARDKDGVYFKDSCENIANIYDASKVNDQSYWEEIIAPEDSCNPDSGNENSESCGNCDFALGGVCSFSTDVEPDYGENICRPTSCEYEGTTYKPGESWCVYEGKIGDGDDIPGSRHTRYRCDNGEINTDEVCGEKRNEVCMNYDTIDGDTGNVLFHESHCVTNPVSADFRINDCLSITQEMFDGGDIGELTKECNENLFCSIKGVHVDNFKFSFCTPDYPIGFEQYPEDENLEQAQEDVCSLGTQSCTITYKKKLFGGKSCKSNCQCDDEIFTQQMNNFCTSLGDCGGNINTGGDFTHQGYSIKRGTWLSAASIKSYKDLLIFASDQLIVRAPGNSSNLTRYYWDWLIEGRYRERVYVIEEYTAALFTFTNGKAYKDGSFLDDWFGWGGTETKVVTFTCAPWQPPKGGDNCDLCNENPDTCNEYKCESLGAACEIINKGEEGEMCISIPFEPYAPVISSGDAPLGLSYTQTDDGFEVLTSEGECVQAPGTYNLTFQTDEHAQCKYAVEFDGETKLLENTEEFFRENMSFFGPNSYLLEHKAEIFFIHPDAGIASGINMTYDQTWYIVCEDKHGNNNWPPYKIDTCIKEAEDVFAPGIGRTFPENNSKIGFDSTNENISVFVSEFPECRWSLEQGVPFKDMINDFTCPEAIGDRTIYGYACEANVPMTEDTNNIYIKCSDQPWLENVEERNVDTDDFVLTLQRVEEKIKIDAIAPSGDLETETISKDIPIRVQTSGGGDEHVCKYQILVDQYNFLPVSDGREHELPEITIPVGSHTLNIRCTDETGDTVEGSSTFRIIQDTRAPKIIRIQETGSTILLVTAEEADCRYSTERCKFKWENGTELSGNTEHTFSKTSGETYYIKCKDEWDNAPSSCSLILGG